MAYFMVSLDEAERNREFAESEGANFVLLSDPTKENAKRYGVLGFGGFWASRVTFYIDASGKLVRIDEEVDTSTHGQDVVKSLRDLGFSARTSTPQTTPQPPSS